MIQSKAIIFTAPDQVSLDTLEVPAPARGELLVKTLYTGVSTGTETRVLAGKQVGGNFPLVPGYENVGKIVESGPETTLKPDQLVFHTGSKFTGRFAKCWGAHQEFTLVYETDVFSVPENLDPVDAIFAKVGAIALHGIKRAKVTEKDTVVVVGLGLIGHLAAQSAKAFGARVIGVDTNHHRLQMAGAAGVEHLVDASTEDVKTAVADYGRQNVSVAIDATGIAATIPQTAQLLREMPWVAPFPASPRLVILGSYTAPIVLDYDPLFLCEADILFSRDTRPEDIHEMMQLLADKKINPAVLNARKYPVSNAPQAYRDLVEHKLMRLIFEWQDKYDSLNIR